MNNSKFTFCVPNLNKIKYLPACIESILAQDCGDWRCVFVDGFSKDGSWEYIQQFASDPRFLLLRGRQQGMYTDWNECLKHVETEYFYFLTSDDTCFPSLVSDTTAALNAYPDIDACNFQFVYIDEEGALIEPYESIIKTSYALYSDVNHCSHIRSGVCEFMMHFVYLSLYRTITSLVFRRNLIEKMEGFTNLYGAIGDYDWTMRLGLFTDVLYIPKLLATWRIYEGQATQHLSSPQNTERFLAIAQKNLYDFAQTEKALLLKNKLDFRQLLSQISDRHAAALYRQIELSKPFRITKPLYIALKNYPFYGIKKALKWLSNNKLYTYYSYSQRGDFACKLIDQYGLSWPPVKVHI